MLEELLELERRGWAALSSDGGRAFYASILHAEALMLFPGGLRLEGKEAILESLEARPWASFEIDEATAIELGPGAGVLAYRVAAARAGAAPYRALISSTYVRVNGAWNLILHQQTPF